MGTLTKRHRERLNKKQKANKPIFFNKVRIDKAPYCYDGPVPENIKESLQALLGDLLAEQDLTCTPAEVEDLINPLAQFIDEFFIRLIQKKSGEQCEVFGSICKDRYKDLIQFLNLYLSDNTNDTSSTLCLFAKATEGDSFSIPLSDIRYLPKRLQGFFLILEDGTIAESVILSHRPNFYSLLYKYIIKLTEFYLSKGIETFGEIKAQETFLLAGSVGQIFEKTNTDKEVKMRYAKETLAMLTGEEEILSPEVKELFEAVVEDLDLDNKRRNHPVYVQDVRRAYRQVKNYLNSPFSDKDLYVSTKATASMIDNKQYASVISSAFETDPIKGHPIIQTFDEAIGFDSSKYYREEPIENYRALVTKTVWINNPNKRKPRAIHIGMNAIQDRCKWCHNRAQAFLNKIDSDCMINHFKGVEFLMRYTQRAYRLQHENSVLNFDFSNATDTLGRQFQYMVVELFHGKETADFWSVISTLPKVAIMPEGNELPYEQTVGQPQGLLWSFDAFSEAHHMIMLMIMKATGRTDIPASEFYALVGDDSAINTVTPDPEGQVKEWYYRICTETNLKVNLSKSNITTGDPMEDVILDFAKTTVRNGQLFTPIPAGLSLSYADDKMLGGVATCLWLASKGVTLKKAMDNSIARNFRNYTQRLIASITIKSGEIPYLQSFRDMGWMEQIPEDLKIAVLFAYLVNLARSSVFDFCLSEKDRSGHTIEELSLQYAWDNIIPSEWEEDIVSWLESAPVDNKYSLLIEDTFKLQKAIQTIYHDMSSFHSTIVAEVLHDKDFNTLQEVANWIYDLGYQEVTRDRKPPFWYGFEMSNYLEQISSICDLHVRSFSGKNRQRAKLLKGLIPTFKEFFGKSEYLSSLIEETSETIISDWLVEEAYIIRPRLRKTQGAKHPRRNCL